MTKTASIITRVDYFGNTAFVVDLNDESWVVLLAGWHYVLKAGCYAGWGNLVRWAIVEHVA